MTPLPFINAKTYYFVFQVQIKINGKDTGLMMKLGAEGEAYFIEQVSDLGDSDSEADGTGSIYAFSERGTDYVISSNPIQIPKEAIHALKGAETDNEFSDVNKQPHASQLIAAEIDPEHSIVSELQGADLKQHEVLDEEQKDFLQIQMQVKKSYKRKKRNNQDQTRQEDKAASDITSNLSQSQVIVDDIEEDEPEPINPELYRASSSALMKYAEEELINQEEISKMNEKKKSQVVQAQKKLILNENSKDNDATNRSVDTGEYLETKRKPSRFFMQPQSPSSAHQTNITFQKPDQKKSRSMSQNFKENQMGVDPLTSIYGGPSIQKSRGNNIACFLRKKQPAVGKNMRTEINKYRQGIDSSSSMSNSDGRDNYEINQQLNQLKVSDGEKKSQNVIATQPQDQINKKTQDLTASDPSNLETMGEQNQDGTNISKVTVDLEKQSKIEDEAKTKEIDQGKVVQEQSQGMWSFFGLFSNASKVPPAEPLQNQQIPDANLTNKLTDMDINDQELNNLNTGVAGDNTPLENEDTQICEGNTEQDHLQIKIQFSLSGDYINKEKIQDCLMREEQVLEYFNHFVVQFDQYQANSSQILSDPCLLVSINDQIYTYQDAMSIIMAQVVFRQCLEEDKKPKSFNSFAEDYGHNKQSKFEELMGQRMMQPNSSSDNIPDQDEENKHSAKDENEHSRDVNAINLSEKKRFKTIINVDVLDDGQDQANPGSLNYENKIPSKSKNDADHLSGIVDQEKGGDPNSNADIELSLKAQFSSTAKRTHEGAQAETKSKQEDLSANSKNKLKPDEPKKPKYRKIQIPIDSQLQNLQKYLNFGKNEIIFQIQGSSAFLKGNIYVWGPNEKIIISDVDGTVTKSDMLGHILPRLGTSDWAHNGIAKLYTNIHRNGYKILYLSSRPIGFSEHTKDYIKNIQQDSKHSMPDGPLLLSPDRMMKSMYREVIIKKPHLFKIKCLKEVMELFPDNNEPFYAGFGNRDTDYISYRTLSISSSKIFIINPKGEVSQFNNSYFQKSYPMINDIYELMFPSIEGPPMPTKLVDVSATIEESQTDSLFISAHDSETKNDQENQFADQAEHQVKVKDDQQTNQDNPVQEIGLVKIEEGAKNANVNNENTQKVSENQLINQKIVESKPAHIAQSSNYQCNNNFQSETFNDLNFWNANINYATLVKSTTGQAASVNDSQQDDQTDSEESSRSNNSWNAANSPAKIKEKSSNYGQSAIIENDKSKPRRGRHKSLYKFGSPKRDKEEAINSDNGGTKFFVFNKEIIDLEHQTSEQDIKDQFDEPKPMKSPNKKKIDSKSQGHILKKRATEYQDNGGVGEEKLVQGGLNDEEIEPQREMTLEDQLIEEYLQQCEEEERLKQEEKQAENSKLGAKK